MAIIDQKRQVFGNIAALRTLNDGFPKLKTSSSFPSVNNQGNSLTFLTDLLKALVGFEVLVGTVVDILTYSLKEIELEIKKALKTELKSIVSCGVDPSIPPFIKSTGSGINFTVNKIDFLDLMLVDPNTTNGKLLYNDVTPTLIQSTDLNTFIYGTIQNDGTPQDWGSSSPLGHNILNIGFVSNGLGTTPNNTITVKANSLYDSSPKTLTDLNNDFIDSVSLFNTENIINRIIDTIFGSVSVSLNKTTKQLENEAKINAVIDSVVNADKDDVIDDGYFVFTKEEIAVQQENVDLKKKGVKKLECCNKVAASIPVSFLNDLTANLSGTTNLIQQKSIISNSLSDMANQNTINSPNASDHTAIKLNFIQEIINNLTKAIVGIILSPKVVMIFMINFKIIYGPQADFTDGVDFLRKNKTLINSIMKTIRNKILTILLALALKQIATMVAEAATKKQIEKGKSNLAQLLSLVGIPQETLKLIQGLV